VPLLFSILAPLSQSASRCGNWEAVCILLGADVNAKGRQVCTSTFACCNLA